MINIIWLTPEFPSNSANTKGMYIYRTVKELSKYFKIYVICLYPASPPVIEMIKYWKDWKKIYNDWKENYSKKSSDFKKLKNFEVIYLRYFRLPRGQFHHIEGWFSYFQARKYIAEIVTPNSIVHANWIFPAGTMANLISKKYNIPFIISLMGSDVNRLNIGSKFWKAAKKLLLSANKVTAVTNDLFDKCKDKNINLNQSKIMQIDNIYETDKFIIKDKQYCRELLSIEINKKVVFFAGGLIPVKNVDVLIEAFDILLTNNSNLLLFIAGSGTEEGNLRRLTELKKIENHVFFLGPLLSDELINYYNATDVFCLPSKSEGLPNVVVESLFCGTPVVASNVGGIPSIINEGENGFLVQPNNSHDLAVKIEKCLGNNWNREKIRKSISHLEPHKVIEKYKILYNDLKELN